MMTELKKNGYQIQVSVYPMTFFVLPQQNQTSSNWTALILHLVSVLS
jgi:hypothetical protein